MTYCFRIFQYQGYMFSYVSDLQKGTLKLSSKGLICFGDIFQNIFKSNFMPKKNCQMIKQSPKLDCGGTSYYGYILIFYLCCTYMLGNFSLPCRLCLGFLWKGYVLYFMHHEQFIYLYIYQLPILFLLLLFISCFRFIFVGFIL